MKDMLCINAEQCGDDVVIVHDGDVQLNLVPDQTVALRSITCTGTLRFRVSAGHRFAYLLVHESIECGELDAERGEGGPLSVNIVGSLCLHSMLPNNWGIERSRCDDCGEAWITLHPPVPAGLIAIRRAFTLSPWEVQLPRSFRRSHAHYECCGSPRVEPVFSGCAPL
jgi:hypothetical protein